MPTYAIQPDDARPDMLPAGRVIPLDPEALLYEIEVAYLTGQSKRTHRPTGKKAPGRNSSSSAPPSVTNGAS